MNRASPRRHWKPAVLVAGVLSAIVAIVIGLSGGGHVQRALATYDVTPTPTATNSQTATATESATVTETATETPTESATPTGTATESPTPTMTATEAASPSPSPSASPSASPSPSPTATLPTIATTPSAGGAVGIVLTDMATLSGGSNPQGSITFSLFAPGDNTCAGPAVFTETVSVNGNNTYSTTTGFTSTTAGTYNWMATFTSSDSNNLNAETACGDEAVVVSTPVVITTPSPTVTETATASATPTESATASVTPTESATVTTTATETGTATATSTTSNVTIETPTTGSNISSSNISSGVSQGGVSSNVSGATLSGATPSAPSTGSAQPNSTSTSPFLWAGFGLLALTAGTAVLFLATRKR